MTKPSPYPADIRAKGWRFELDYEQIEQSATWQLAAEVPMAQHALLMLWMVAWSKQVPCGSLPNDEAVIRAACRIPAAMWPEMREILLRGWWLADDGRLYHDTLTARVLEMASKRKADAARTAAHRAKRAMDSQQGNGEVTPESRVTDAGLTREFDTNHQPPTTGTKEDKEKPARKRAASSLLPIRPFGVEQQTWDDWLALRKSKRAPVTETVVAEATSEAAKAGMTLDAFLRIWCVRGSQGLQADWLKPAERGNVVSAPFFNKQLAIEAEGKRVADQWVEMMRQQGESA